jgi:hypothetical protein
VRWSIRRVALTAALSVLALVVAGVAVRDWLPRPLLGSSLRAPGSLRVHGDRVPYAGALPWSEPVATTSTTRTITVYADGDRLPSRYCGLPAERVHVHQDAHAVTILVVGYEHALPAGTGCGGVGHGLQPHHVHLRAPLVARRLRDAFDGSTHRLLVASSVPTLTAPAGLPQQSLTWDEDTGEVERTWTDPRTPDGAGLDLEQAPAGAIEAHDGPASAINPDGPNGTLVASDIPVPGPAGGTAKAWDYLYLYGENVTLRWVDTDGLHH